MKFKKGHIAWNKGIKGIRLSPNSEFKADGTNTGSQHKSWTGGVQKMSNDCVYLWMGTNHRERRPRVIYEKTIGKIPDGYVIIHLDNDKTNDNPENLSAISRADNLKRNTNNKT